MPQPVNNINILVVTMGRLLDRCDGPTVHTVDPTEEVPLLSTRSLVKLVWAPFCKRILGPGYIMQHTINLGKR